MIDRNNIITLPNSHLRQKSAVITKVTKDIQQLIQDMEAATLDWEDHRPHEIGVALAAVQIDHLKRVVIIRNDFDNKEDRSFFTLINPTITKAYGDLVYDYEGCLSVIDVYGRVPRYNKVKVTALTPDGQEIRINAEGFLARTLQHEIDHTNGILFIDHIKDQDAFYHLNDEGKLEKLDDEKISASHILWK
jgi:peptide deformylase